MNPYKKFSLGLPIAIIMSQIIPATWLYLYDPLQLYHKPYFRETTFSYDMRVQNKGIIKHYDFNSYIVGTSMVEHIPIDTINAITQQKWVNIMMYGSSFDERAIILQYLFTIRKPKNIIYSLDHFSLIKPTAQPRNFAFLYDSNEFDDIKLYFNQKYMFCAFLWSQKEKCVGVSKPLATLNPDIALAESLGKKFGGFEKWVQYEDNRIHDALEWLRNFKGEDYPDTSTLKQITSHLDIESSKEYVHQYVLSFVSQNPQTHFDFIIPPYSRLHWRIQKPDDYAYWQQVIKWFVTIIAQYPNATLYGFDDMEYMDYINNYMDLTHYNVDMHKYFTQAIATQTHIVTPENIDAYLDTMEQKIRTYNLAPLIEILTKQDSLKSKNPNTDMEK